MKQAFSILLYLLYGSFALGQSAGKYKVPGLFSIGYQNIILIDSCRLYKPGAGSTENFHFRPVEIDLWYPALIHKSNPVVRYGEFVNLLEQRSNRFQDDTLYKGLSAEIIQYLGVNLKITDTGKLNILKTKSYLNAEAIIQPFPLIIYMSSFNGMSYENIGFFEWFSSHGFIVASISSVGRYPGNMSTDPADLSEQIKDGLFAINLLKNRKNIDSAKIGIVGYSWGGLAALNLAMTCKEIKAFLSLDGSEMHYYGDSKLEDSDFDLLRHSPFFQVDNLNIPYAYLESGNKQNDRNVDSIYNFHSLIRFPKQYIHFPSASHEDFSYLPSLATQIYGKNKSWNRLYLSFNQYALNFFDQSFNPQLRPGAVLFPGLFKQIIFDTLSPVLKTAAIRQNKRIVSGRVIDAQNQDSLAYVNVGIPGKNTGTVTQRNGTFQLSINPDFQEDSLRFSMAGYQTVSFSIRDLLLKSLPIVVPLKQKIPELEAVVVMTKVLATKTKGNTTTSKFLSIGLPLKFLGSETGIRIKLNKKPVLIKSFSFNVSDNRLDTAVFRLNIYNFKSGVPFENILKHNILVPIGKQTGRCTVNLSEYKLILKDDILISLEWIEGSSSGPQNGAIFLSAGLLNSATWHRLTSQAEWKKASGIGVGFNIDVQNQIP